MSTWWVSTLGSDANSGTTYSDAKATLEGVRALLGTVQKGDVVNVVNDGLHAMVASATDWLGVLGTSYDTDPGLTIQGVTDTGTPALVTIVAAAGLKQWLNVGESSAYFTTKGIKFDYSALIATAETNMWPIQFDIKPKEHRVVDCECWFGAVGVTISATEIPSLVAYNGAGTVSEVSTVEVTNCVLVNSNLEVLSTGGTETDYHHNVVIHDAEGIPASQRMVAYASGAPNQPRKFYHNTMVMIKYAAEDATTLLDSPGDDTTQLSVHSNLIYVDCGPSATTTKLQGGLYDGSVGATPGVAGTMGYDLIALGVNISDDYVNWTGIEPGLASYQYNYNWRASATAIGTDVDPNSVLLQNQAFTDVFAGVASFDWTPGDVYTHTLPYDLRPLVGLNTGLSDTVAGAIDASEIDPDVDDPSYEEGKNYIDALPFYLPVIKADMTAAFIVRRNNVRDHIDFRHYLTDHIHDESTHRLMRLAVAATHVLTLGGVYRATGLLLTTDQQLTMDVTYYNGTADVVLSVTVDEMFALDQCMVRRVSVTNAATDTASVRLIVFD